MMEEILEGYSVDLVQCLVIMLAVVEAFSIEIIKQFFAHRSGLTSQS
jgi:hypothetical protein